MKTLCRGSMRTGERTPQPAAPRLVACVLCGRVFMTMRPHTAQVPRHRPKVTMHRRGRWMLVRPRCTVEPVGDSAVVASLRGPDWIGVGDLILHRVPGDFPDELVFCGSSGEYTLWVKSKELLVGPWDWVIEEGRTPIDLGGPFPTREFATADLAARLVATGIACPPPADEIVSVPAAPAPAPAPAHAPGQEVLPADDDPEFMGMALDLAILALRRARARLAPARVS